MNNYTIEKQKYAVKKLTGAFSTKPKLKKFIEDIVFLWCEPIGNIKLDLRINYATGYSLDIIGSWFKVYRENRTDDDYRRAIQLQIQIENNNDISEEFLRQTLILILGAKQCFLQYIGENVLICYLRLENEQQIEQLKDYFDIFDYIVPAGISFYLKATNGRIIKQEQKNGEISYGCILGDENDRPIITENGEFILVQSFVTVQVK